MPALLVILILAPSISARGFQLQRGSDRRDTRKTLLSNFNRVAPARNSIKDSYSGGMYLHVLAMLFVQVQVIRIGGSS